MGKSNGKEFPVLTRARTYHPDGVPERAGVPSNLVSMSRFHRQFRPGTPLKPYRQVP